MTSAPKPQPRVRVSQPESILAKLVMRPGGLPRATAIAQAERCVEAQRQPACAAIGTFVAALEVRVSLGSHITPEQLPELRRIANQLVALASGYELQPLAEAGKHLCDLIVHFVQSKSLNHDSIAVYVRALRLLMVDPGPVVSASILAELDKVTAHFRAGTTPA